MMEYTIEEFLVDLRNIKPVEYFRNKPLPNVNLATVIAETNNINVIDYYSDKLSTDGAIHNAILLDKISVANSLLSKGVTYVADKLVFRYATSVEWGIQHGIKFHIDQLRRYHIDTDVVKLVLNYQPDLLQDMNLTKCNDNVIHCILLYSNPKITNELVAYVCSKGYYKAFIELAKHINVKQYLSIIATGTIDIIDYVLSITDVTIDSLPINSLFSGIHVYDKVVKYHDSIPNLQGILNNGLLQQLFDNKNYDAIIYLGEIYVLSLPELSPIETIRLAMINQLHIDANDDFCLDKDMYLASKEEITKFNANTVNDLYKKYNEQSYI